jgi:hypothetical protein
MVQRVCAAPTSVPCLKLQRWVCGWVHVLPSVFLCTGVRRLVVAHAAASYNHILWVREPHTVGT